MYKNWCFTLSTFPIIRAAVKIPKDTRFRVYNRNTANTCIFLIAEDAANNQ